MNPRPKQLPPGSLRACPGFWFSLGGSSRRDPLLPAAVSVPHRRRGAPDAAIRSISRRSPVRRTDRGQRPRSKSRDSRLYCLRSEGESVGLVGVCKRLRCNARGSRLAIPKLNCPVETGRPHEAELVATLILPSRALRHSCCESRSRHGRQVAWLSDLRRGGCCGAFGLKMNVDGPLARAGGV